MKTLITVMCDGLQPKTDIGLENCFRDYNGLVMKRKTMISLFSGAGGLDRGLQEAGFESKLFVEINSDAKLTLTKNNPSATLSDPGDIHLLTADEILEQAQLKKEELDLLAGGPPCQPFSKSGYWVTGDTERLSDPRAKTLRAYLKIVDGTLPKVLLLENVKGIAYNKKDEGLKLLIKELKKINLKNNTNYDPVVVSINSASYGVPQVRERVFIIACRDGSVFNMPKETHFDPIKSPGTNSPYMTSWDAIGDLDMDIWPDNLKTTGKWAELLPSIPEGHNYLWHTVRMSGEPIFGWRTRYWSFLLKLAKDLPSWTIQAQPGPATGPFHWKNRLLSERELARIQTFPDDYKFVGERRSVQKQIGNAVPPAIGELFGLEIRRQFFRQRVRKKLRLIPERSSSIPQPEPRKKVLAKYKELIGVHQSHPGTGKGPGAINREKASNYEM